MTHHVRLVLRRGERGPRTMRGPCFYRILYLAQPRQFFFGVFAHPRPVARGAQGRLPARSWLGRSRVRSPSNHLHIVRLAVWNHAPEVAGNGGCRSLLRIRRKPPWLLAMPRPTPKSRSAPSPSIPQTPRDDGAIPRPKIAKVLIVPSIPAPRARTDEIGMCSMAALFGCAVNSGPRHDYVTALVSVRPCGEEPVSPMTRVSSPLIEPSALGIGPIVGTAVGVDAAASSSLGNRSFAHVDPSAWHPRRHHSVSARR